MKKRVLFIIESDPRASHRPAEAVRIAAGIAVWKQVEIGLYFRGAAIIALGDDAETLIDGDNFPRYLPILREAGGRILSGDDDLAALAAQHTTVARF